MQPQFSKYQRGFSLLESLLVLTLTSVLCYGLFQAGSSIGSWSGRFKDDDDRATLRNEIRLRMQCSDTVLGDTGACTTDVPILGKNASTIIAASTPYTKIGNYYLKANCTQDATQNKYYNISYKKEGEANWRTDYLFNRIPLVCSAGVQNLCSTYSFCSGKVSCPATAAAANPILITTTAQFKAIASDKYYKLMNDIDLNGPMMASVNGLENTVIDGNGHSILNLKPGITAGLSLFPQISNAIIYNMKLVNTQFNPLDISWPPFAGQVYGNTCFEKIDVVGGSGVAPSGFLLTVETDNGNPTSNVVLQDVSTNFQLLESNLVNVLFQPSGGIVSRQLKADLTLIRVTRDGNVPGLIHSGGLIGIQGTALGGGSLTIDQSEFKNGYVGVVNFPDEATNPGYCGGLIAGGSLPTKITNSKTSNADIRCQQLVGGLVGTFSDFGTNPSLIIDHSQTSGMVRGADSIGGIIGRLEGNALIQNSFSSANITSINGAAGSSHGGLIGFINAGNTSLKNLSYSGTLTSYASNVGGIVGYNLNSTIDASDLQFTGNITESGATNVSIGGIIGRDISTNSRYDKLTVTGNITATPVIVPTSFPLGVGGAFGWMNATNTTVNRVAVTGALLNNNGDAAGIILGMLGTGSFQNSYFSGTITSVGGDSAGITVDTSAAIPITNVYNAASSMTVTAPAVKLGICRTCAGLTNSYWDQNTTGIATGTSGSPRTTTSLKTSQADYVGWDFSTIWSFTNGSYPTLR